MKILGGILEALNLTHTQKRVTGNIAWLVGGHVFRIAVGLVVLGAMARYLGPDEFGIVQAGRGPGGRGRFGRRERLRGRD